MKRHKPFDARYEAFIASRRKHDAAKLERFWREKGLNPVGLYVLLFVTRLRRAAYEWAKEEKPIRERDNRMLDAAQRKRRSDLSAVKRTRDLIRAYDPPKQLLRSFEIQLDQIIIQPQGAPPPSPTIGFSLPTHHPGSPWVKDFVVQAVPFFRAHGCSWWRTRKALWEALRMAGHEDVTLDQIKYFVQRQRRADSGFGDPLKRLPALLATADRCFQETLDRTPYIHDYVRDVGLLRLVSPLRLKSART